MQTAQTIPIKRFAASVLVLLAAVGIGMIIREYRFRSTGEKHQAQAPKAAQPAGIGQTDLESKKPEEIRNTQEQSSVEQVVVEQEPLSSETIDTPTSPEDANSQSDTEAPAESAAPPDQEQSLNDPVLQEQRGRAALALIGHDPSADEVWIQVINDPSVSANARKNLIEDLNEDGLNYRNLTPDDLPVILYRIQLIEQLAPNAMDQVNSDAFKEAYKDLVNMVDRLGRQ